MKDPEFLQKQIPSPLKSFSGRKKGKTFSEESLQKLENLKRFNQPLKALIQEKKASIGSTKAGKGMKFKSSKKLTNDGMFGTFGWAERS